MKKLLLLAAIPFACLVACNKSTGPSSGPTDCGTVQLSKNQRSVRISGKKLELEAVNNIMFTDPKDYPDSYFGFNPADSAFRLNYRVQNVRYLQLEFFENVSMIKSTHIYIEFYQNESDVSPVYTVGGKIGVDVLQLNGERRKVSIGNINNSGEENAENAYMHVRFSGPESGLQGMVSVIFGDLTVTTK